MVNFIKKYVKQLTVGIMFFLMYVPTFIWMWDRWFLRGSYYSHGILIPAVSAFLIWQKKDELVSLKFKKSAWGMPLIIIGILVHVLSSCVRVYFTSGFSILMVLAGLILYFYGSTVLKRIWFPVFFLIFMVPVPLIMISDISFKMKLLAAEIATMTLNKIGIVAVREGSLIKLNSANMMVDDVCSGLRSLISLTALGSVFAYWMKSILVKRLTLFLSTIPIAIVTNVFRIVFLSIVSEAWGPKYAFGFIHDVAGFLVFALAFILLFIVGKILE